MGLTARFNLINTGTVPVSGLRTFLVRRGKSGSVFSCCRSLLAVLGSGGGDPAC